MFKIFLTAANQYPHRFSFLEHCSPLPLLVAKAVNYAAANLEMKIVPEIQYTFLTCRVRFKSRPPIEA